MAEDKSKKSKRRKLPAKVDKDCFFDVTAHGERTINSDGIAMVTNLASIGCTMTEIADMMNCDFKTLTADHNREAVKRAHERGISAKHVTTRKALMERIKNGSDKCIIFDCKASLGMSDTILPSTEASALNSLVDAINRMNFEGDSDEEPSETGENTSEGENGRE